jgi:hypothetical protein
MSAIINYNTSLVTAPQTARLPLNGESNSVETDGHRGVAP